MADCNILLNYSVRFIIYNITEHVYRDFLLQKRNRVVYIKKKGGWEYNLD